MYLAFFWVTSVFYADISRADCEVKGKSKAVGDRWDFSALFNYTIVAESPLQCKV